LPSKKLIIKCIIYYYVTKHEGNFKEVMRVLKGDFESLEEAKKCGVSAKFGQMRAFLKLQIIYNNLKLGEMHDNQEKVQNLT